MFPTGGYVSHWRIIHRKKDFYYFLGHELYERLHPNWCTPSLVGKRGDDVKEWLVINGYRPHVILDDSGDYHKDQPLIRINPSLGLQDCDLDNAALFVCLS